MPGRFPNYLSFPRVGKDGWRSGSTITFHIGVLSLGGAGEEREREGGGRMTGGAGVQRSTPLGKIRVPVAILFVLCKMDGAFCAVRARAAVSGALGLLWVASVGLGLGWLALLGPSAWASGRVACGTPPAGPGVDPLEKGADFFVSWWAMSICPGAIVGTFTATVVSGAWMAG